MSPPPPSPTNMLTKSRPKHPPRMGSFSKRAASVDGLREVPLPSKEDAGPGSRLRKERIGSDDEDWEQASCNDPQPSTSTTPQTILPYSRPYSQPPPSPNTAPSTPTAGDRMSSASLPLPSQIPYHSLPQVVANTIPEDSEAAPPQAATATAPHGLLHGLSPTSPRPHSLPPTAIPRPPSISRQRPSTASSYASSASSTYPPPEPPQILQPAQPPPAATLNATEPHASFLPPAAQPADAWIEVETTPTEYRLNVRLPGFKRDAITLATKKRRILHVVADSWEVGGGHFERRISFGYDADLVSVRAEFDGEMLRVIVPRRGT